MRRRKKKKKKESTALTLPWTVAEEPWTKSLWSLECWSLCSAWTQPFTDLLESLKACQYVNGWAQGTLRRTYEWMQHTSKLGHNNPCIIRSLCYQDFRFLCFLLLYYKHNMIFGAASSACDINEHLFLFLWKHLGTPDRPHKPGGWIQRLMTTLQQPRSHLTERLLLFTSQKLTALQKSYQFR